MKILIATDGSKYSKGAVEKCCEIFSDCNECSIRIVTVADIAPPIRADHFGVSNELNMTLANQLKKNARLFVSEAKEIVSGSVNSAVGIETAVLVGPPKIAIVEEAERWEADLIIVGSHGYGFFERMLIGSVSDAILHHAPCSVLVVKPGNELKTES